MNFFEHQAAARRTSTRLVVLFALAVLGIVLAVDFAVYVLFGGASGQGGALLAFTTVATLGIIGLGSLYRIASLRGGGEPVALQLGGVPVPEDTADFNLRRLRNVVEEIAIASGVPVPKVYVLEHEAAINAFAAGYTPSDAVVAVTRGALDRLNRDELQGVIAHEFSHILNGDMRLNVRLIGVLFGILMLGIIGRKVLQFGPRGRNNKGAGAIMVAALVALVVGYIGLFFGRMIKAGVSRTRESLADASAVQFTRQTQGLAGALKKIGGLGEGSKLNDRGDAEEVSHMLFGDGIGFSGLFATHPPLLKRIQLLDPQFRADQLGELQRRWLASPPDGLEEDARLGLTAGTAAALPGAASQFSVTPPMVVAQVATPAADDYRRADAIVARIPDELRALAARRDAVMPLLLGLLLADDPALARIQGTEISARLGAAAAEAATALHARQLAGLHPMLRLPLAALAFPVLRLRPRPELDTFLDTVHAVVNADGEVSLFEYCLGRLLQVQVRESLDPGRNATFGRRKLSAVRSEVSTLLCVVAQAGNGNPADAQRAYLAGIQRVLPSDHLPYLAREGVRALDAVWEPLDALDPLARQALVEGITATISHDGRVNVAESELLRTICGVLHCPLPPMLEHS
ncbi:M48 family metallopeptidase [Luteimonas sp. 50]|uniref:M48 family metallopeptidase n=1 Tax=Cognatiluteimonas sedimenti TaxID=2927791 RepID=A0ABT0A422_9GAMM|nr:M48 family metallopeptidase [Lysobacter sedimenti]MCJ0825729.1 M48 family metallopeptidase [Lysobacter sedimenti]